MTGRKAANKVRPSFLQTSWLLRAISTVRLRATSMEGGDVPLTFSKLRAALDHQPTSKEMRPVKKLTTIAIALMFLTSFVGFAAASGTTAPKPADKPAEKMPADKMEKMDKKPMAKTANGTVKSASADSLVVAGKEGKGKDAKDAEWTFAVDAKTKIKKGGKDAMAADVKAGDSVQVKYMEKDGKAMAQSVMVKGGMGKKAENPCAAKGAAKNPCAAKTEKK